MAQSYVGALGQRKAGEDQMALAQQAQTRRGADMEALVRALRGQPAQGATMSEDAAGNVTPMPAQPAMTPSQSISNVLPLLGPETQGTALNLMVGQQNREDQQQFQASQAREAQAARLQERLLSIQAAQAQAAQSEQTRRDLAAQADQTRRELAQLQRESTETLHREATAARLEVAGNKPLTEFQGKNLLFGSRAALSDKVLRELEDKISVTGLAAKQGVSKLPLIGGIAGAAANLTLSPEAQKVEQAQRDFVNAVLRQESGATIAPSEFDNAVKQYFPQPGDGKEVLEQKRRNRQTAIQAFRVLAGPGGAQMDQLVNTPLMPTSATATPGAAPSANDPLGLRGR
jgi:hypothetical protein